MAVALVGSLRIGKSASFLSTTRWPSVPLTIRILETDADITAAFPLMATLRDRVRVETFLAEVRRQQRDGYHLAAGFAGAELVALAGFRPGHTLSRGEHLFVDDLITAA